MKKSLQKIICLRIPNLSLVVLYCTFVMYWRRVHSTSQWWSLCKKGDGCTSWSIHSIENYKCNQTDNFVISHVKLCVWWQVEITKNWLSAPKKPSISTTMYSPFFKMDLHCLSKKLQMILISISYATWCYYDGEPGWPSRCSVSATIFCQGSARSDW